MVVFLVVQTLMVPHMVQVIHKNMMVQLLMSLNKMLIEIFQVFRINNLK